MKTNFLCGLLFLGLLSSFTPEDETFECVPATSDFDVILTDLGGTPISSVVGNTQYYIKASWANGNGWYEIDAISGYTVLSSNPEDSQSPYTNFRIQTNPGVIHIHGTMVSGSGCDETSGSVIFGW